MSFFFSVALFVAPNAQAQQPTVDPNITPTSQRQEGIPTPPAERTGNCDVCGYCEGSQPPGRWESCRDCVYPGVGDAAAGQNQTLIGIPTPDPFHYYTDLGCISTRPEEFASQISGFFFSIVGGIAFLTFLYGAGVIATARSNPERLNQGKRIVIGAIVGLLFAIFAILIVQFLAGGLGLSL